MIPNAKVLKACVSQPSLPVVPLNSDLMYSRSYAHAERPPPLMQTYTNLSYLAVRQALSQTFSMRFLLLNVQCVGSKSEHWCHARIRNRSDVQGALAGHFSEAYHPAFHSSERLLLEPSFLSL